MLNKTRIKHRILAAVSLEKEMDDQPSDFSRRLRRLEERRGQSADEWMPKHEPTGFESVGLTRRVR